jgi:phospholipid N-methyltransferase
MHSISENLAFFRAFLRAPKMVGSIIPTSSLVIERLLGQGNWSTARLIVEYGPGLGTFTRSILKKLARNGLLIAIDPNADFVAHLRQTITDPRLIIVEGSAADVEEIIARYAPGQSVDHVISGLPFSTLPCGIGTHIVAATQQILAPRGSFLIYQYSRFVLPLLKPYFARIDQMRIWPNIPPCVLFAAYKMGSSHENSGGA